MTQRKELQKHSNILLTSFGMSDFLTFIASLPAVTSTKSWTCMYNIQWSNEVRFPCYLFSIPPNHGCLGKVRGRKEMDGLQGNCNKTPSYQDRNIRLVVGDFHARLPLHIMGVTSADTETKRIWIMITNACAMMNVVIIVYFYAMIYHGIRQRRTSDKVMLHEMIRNDDF